MRGEFDRGGADLEPHKGADNTDSNGEEEVCPGDDGVSRLSEVPDCQDHHLPPPRCRPFSCLTGPERVGEFTTKLAIAEL